MKQSRRQRTMISAAVLIAQRYIAPTVAFIGARTGPSLAPSLYRHRVASSLPIVGSPLLRASSTDSSAGNAISTEPTLEQTLSAAAYVKTQLDSIVNSGRRDLSSVPRQEMLLNDLHSIASALLEYDANNEAADLFRYSLDEFDPTNIAVRERLSAALRAMGSMEDSARELYRVIHTLEEEINSQDQMGMVGADSGESLSWLYLDLGGLIEQIQPLPGAGPNWDAAIQTEAEAPKVTLEFDSELEDGFTISLDDDDEEVEEDLLGDDDRESKGTQREDLSAIDCYRRAMSYNQKNGSAHKRLADALAIIGQNGEALQEFEVASKLMPMDICCATHVYHGKHLDMQTKKDALAMAAGPSSKLLDDLKWNANGLLQNDESEISDMAAAFERDGVIVLPALVSQDECDHMLELVDDIILKAAAGGDIDDTQDFTDETRSAANRVHLALPLEGDHSDTLSTLFGKLYPLLDKVLACSGNKIPLLGAGFMRTSPGAKGQELHKDVHHYDRHLSVDDMPEGASDSHGEARCVSIQLQLTDTSSGEGDLGSLEVLPGSHRPDAPNGRPAAIEKAVKDPKHGSNGVIPVDVLPGTVTIYSSRLWHRGGANASSGRARTFAFFTVTEPNCVAPPGLIHTLERQDVGQWTVSEVGLSRQE